VTSADAKTGEVTLVNPHDDAGRGQQPRQLAFDSVLPSGRAGGQQAVYDSAARGIVDGVLDGYNGAVYCYGQTGSGKTFTMQGVTGASTPELHGILPRSFRHIFEVLDIRLAPLADGDADGGGGYTRGLVLASYLEIYNEQITDLLGPAGKRRGQESALKIRQGRAAAESVFVEGLEWVAAHSAADLDALLDRGHHNRMVAATMMGASTSRSHVVFSVTVECGRTGAGGREHVRVGKLCCVDMAGRWVGGLLTFCACSSKRSVPRIAQGSHSHQSSHTTF
jgi:kinesin family protein 3/17